MFSLKRIVILLIVTLGITTTLYYLDSDPPTDDIFQRAVMTGIVLIVVTIFYMSGYGLLREARRRRGNV